jgi:hypothetical protein
MNKTQKGAWFTLILAVLFIIFSLLIYAQIFSVGPISSKLVRAWGLLILLFIYASAVFLHIKQRSAKVDSDERDDLIKKRATSVCFASVWILLIAASIIPLFVVGDWGSIPVSLLPIINFGVFLIAMLVYSIAVLVQYGWEGKGEKL